MGHYLSYLMGAEKIWDKDLVDLGIGIEETMADGDRTLKIPEEKISQYIELIKAKLDSGFWNEVIGEKEIIFIFRFKDGSIKEYRLSPEKEQDQHIFAKLEQFKNKKLIPEQEELIKLLYTQLETDWRTPLEEYIDKLLKEL